MAAKREPVAISTTVGDAISTAFGIIEDLATEMRDAYDNTPESLQSSGVGEARGEAADALEGISEVDDVPEQVCRAEGDVLCAASQGQGIAARPYG